MTLIILFQGVYEQGEQGNLGYFFFYLKYQEKLKDEYTGLSHGWKCQDV